MLLLLFRLSLLVVLPDNFWIFRLFDLCPLHILLIILTVHVDCKHQDPVHCQRALRPGGRTDVFLQLGLVFDLVTARGRCFELLANAFYFIKKGVFAEAPVHLLIQHRFAFVNEGALHLVNVYMSCNRT